MTLTQSLSTLALLTLSATPAWARQTKKVDVSFQSFHTYYSCSGAEDDVRDMLSKLGAQNIETNCNGGLEMHAPYVDVSATFTVADESDAGATWQTVKINTFSGCFFDKSAWSQILPAFKTDNVQASNTCWEDNDQGFRATLSVWK